MKKNLSKKISYSQLRLEKERLGVKPFRRVAFPIANRTPEFLIVVLTAIFSFPFFRLPFQADDEIFMFNMSHFYLQHPIEIFHQTLTSFHVDYAANGRLILFSHLFALVGIALTSLVGQIFSLDAIASYSVVGILLNILLGLASLRLLKTLTSTKSFSGNLYYIYALIFPITILSNESFSGFRMIYWNYTFEVVVAVFLLSLVVNVAKMSKSIRQLLFIIGLCVCFLFGNEITQFFGFIAIPLYMFVKYDNTLKISWKQSSSSAITKLRTIIDIPLITFSLIYFLTSIFIRIHQHHICPDANSCYASANLNVTKWNFESLISSLIKAIGDFPPFGFTYWLNNRDFHMQALMLTIGAAIVGFGGTFLAWIKMKQNSIRQSKESTNSDRDISLRSLFFLFGSIAFLVPLLQSFIVASQKTSIVLSDIGKSDRSITLSQPFVALTISVIIFGTFNIAKSENLKKFIYLCIAFLATFNFLVNISVSTGQRATNEFRIQSMLATELKVAAILPGDDNRRCAEFKDKLLKAKTWKGHDLLVYDGLNSEYLHNYKVPFCSIETDSMFANYI